MHIDRKTAAVIAIIPFLIAMMALAQNMSLRSPNAGLGLLLVFGITLRLIYRLMTWVERGALPSHQRDRRKIDRLLNVLDEHELDLLRERLVYNEDDNASSDGEYESLETLLNQQKQKR